MRTLVIWGCGGHGRVVLDVAIATRAFEEIAFFDNSPPSEDRIAGVRVLSGDIARIVGLNKGSVTEFIIAIGSNRTRADRFAEAQQAGLLAATCIHPSAVISPSATIGPGTVVMPRAVIQADARIGLNCIVNTGAIVEHDCIIGDHTHLSPAATLGGGVKIGRFVHVGIGGIAIPGSTIGDDAVIGAGAVVLGGVPANMTAVGVPAKPLIRRNGS